MSLKKKSCDILVVGGGPAGLMAAWSAASCGASVVLAEALKRPGLKLLASGAGKCNLTNVLPPSGIAKGFGANWRFLLPSLHEFPPNMFRSWLTSRGVPTYEPDNFHVFPVSERAGDVLEALQKSGEMLNVEYLSSQPVAQIKRHAESVLWSSKTTDYEIISSKIIIAGGGIGYPALGAGGLAYRVAEELGHHIQKPLPALVGVKIREKWVGELTGIVLDSAEVTLGGKRQNPGEFLFTHNGISGPAVLDWSGELSERLLSSKEVPIKVNFQSTLKRSDYENFFNTWREQFGARKLNNLMISDLAWPRRLIAALLKEAGVSEEKTAAQLGRAERLKLIELLAAAPLTATGTAGWEKAMVTKGGVSLKEVDSNTLESRIAPGCYFAGEVLDLNGNCGGFNIQWAISSGYWSGRCAAEALAKS